MSFVAPSLGRRADPKFYPGAGGTARTKGIGLFYEVPKHIMQSMRIYQQYRQYTPYYYQDRLDFELSRRLKSDIVKYSDYLAIRDALQEKFQTKQRSTAGGRFYQKRQGSRASYSRRHANNIYACSSCIKSSQYCHEQCLSRLFDKGYMAGVLDVWNYYQRDEQYGRRVYNKRPRG